MIANSEQMGITHTGSSKFSKEQREFAMNDLLLIPTASKNLLSIHQFWLENRVFLEFDCQHVKVKDVDIKQMQGVQKHGFYQLLMVIDCSGHAMMREKTQATIGLVICIIEKLMP